jgi:hypothetical protein
MQRLPQQTAASTSKHDNGEGRCQGRNFWKILRRAPSFLPWGHGDIIKSPNMEKWNSRYRTSLSSHGGAARNVVTLGQKIRYFLAVTVLQPAAAGVQTPGIVHIISQELGKLSLGWQTEKSISQFTGQHSMRGQQ